MDYGPPHSNHPKPNSGATKQKYVRSKIHHNFPDNKDSSDTLSLSSSSSSSSDEFFEVNPHILRDHNKPPHSNRDSKHEVYENEVTSDYMSSDITHESLMLQFSSTQSPPLQIMEKNMEFDPNRIPDSIFSKCSTPTEWSGASNESLFTLRVGGSSFCRDHISMTDIDLPKAAELLNSRELEAPKGSGELIRFGPTDLSFKRTEPYFDVENNIIAWDVKPKETRIVAEPINGSLKKDPIIGVSRNSYERNYHCDQSKICVNPFAKPKPTGEKSLSCPLCHCHNCCGELFCCKCFTCSCKWHWWPTFSSQWCVWPGCSKICSSCRCKCPNFLSCSKICSSCCRCPNFSSCSIICSSCCCWCPNFSSCSKIYSSCCCRCPNFSSCSKICSSCCCWCPNFSSCSKICSSCCCGCPNFSSCSKIFSSCCCSCPNFSSCSKICTSCCCRCPNFSSLCCKCMSCSYCMCSSWPSCNYGCLSFAKACCCCWKREKTFTCSFPIMYASSLSSTMV